MPAEAPKPLPGDTLCRRQHGLALGIVGLVGRVVTPEFLHLVLEGQLAPLQLHDLEIVDGRMKHRFIDLALDIAVSALKLFKMGCKSHDWFSLSWFPRCTRDGATTADYAP
jgi:hypothetical protein